MTTYIRKNGSRPLWREVAGAGWRLGGAVMRLMVAVVAQVAVVVFAVAYVRGWDVRELVFWGIGALLLSEMTWHERKSA